MIYVPRTFAYCTYCPKQWLLFADGTCPVCERKNGYPNRQPTQVQLEGKAEVKTSS